MAYLFVYICVFNELSINLAWIEVWLFFPTELERSAVQMSQMYCKNLPLSKDLDPQESMHGEELLSMACNVLVQVSYAISKNLLLRCYLEISLYLKKIRLTYFL